MVKAFNAFESMQQKNETSLNALRSTFENNIKFSKAKKNTYKRVLCITLNISSLAFSLLLDGILITLVNPGKYSL